jgi:hypothetical protein
MPNNLVSEKPVELGKLIQVAYLVVILSAFAWAKEFLLPLILAIHAGGSGSNKLSAQVPR